MWASDPFPSCKTYPQINRGSYSTVWETVHRVSGTRYATKIFDRRVLSPKEDAAAKREVMMLKQLGDVPIGTVCLIDSFEDPSHFYVVMDYVEGTCLHSLVHQKRLSEKQARRVAKSLLQGVRYLHNQGICHRNLKPDNILLSHEGCDTTITDFGLAAFLPVTDGERGSLTGRCGSATYAAPEVQQSLPYDCSSDIWSVGVVMYFCIAGHAPFVDKTKRGLLRKIVKGEYSFSSKRWSGVSHSAKRFIASLLKVDPNMRLTAEEALYHPWLINSTPLPPIKEEPPPKKKTRKLSRVFKVLRGNSQSKLVVDDDSVSSRTMSLDSTEIYDSFTRSPTQIK
jgi:serine/threonine protein kinase